MSRITLVPLFALAFAATVLAQREEKPTAPQVARIHQGGRPRVGARFPLPAPIKPAVWLSEEHRRTCRKFVGDSVDNVPVVDFAGQTHQLESLLSDRLTVLVFWNEESVLAMEQFRRIPVDVLATFAKHRVKVITAHVGGDAERTRIQTGDAVDKIVSLTDAQGQLFAQLAKSRVPRTYLLDAQGKILWFDVEYTSNTVRKLAGAIAYHLLQSK